MYIYMYIYIYNTAAGWENVNPKEFCGRKSRTPANWHNKIAQRCKDSSEVMLPVGRRSMSATTQDLADRTGKQCGLELFSFETPFNDVSPWFSVFRSPRRIVHFRGKWSFFLFFWLNSHFRSQKVVQSARITCLRGNPIPFPSSGGSNKSEKLKDSQKHGPRAYLMVVGWRHMCVLI